jgi:uncharacterized protein YqgV (UPF0045/DUF77 family)
MSMISAQISMYPLRQADLKPTISLALEIFRARGLEVRVGTMSTLVYGQPDALLDAFKTAFRSAAELGDVVMVTALSNCCPAPTPECTAQ